MSPIIASILRWAARVSTIFIAATFMLFVLGEPKGPLPAVLSRDGIGMLLLVGSILFMLAAWKWEFPAALISLFALGAFAAVVHMKSYDVLFVIAIPNVLFLLDWKLRHLPAR